MTSGAERRRAFQAYRDVNGERHHQSGDQQIGDGQTDDEVVGGRLEGPLPVNAQNDQHVAENGQQREEEEQKGPEVLGFVFVADGGAVVVRSVGVVVVLADPHVANGRTTVEDAASVSDGWY